MKRLGQNLAVLIAAVAVCAGPVAGSDHPAKGKQETAQQTAEKPHVELPANPRDLIRLAIDNQLKNTTRDQLSTWKEKDVKPRGTTVKVMIETPNGVLGRIVEKDGHPLSPEDRQKEDDRVNRLLDPDQMRQKAKEQKQDEERTLKMLKAIPDAFLFAYDGTSTSSNGDTLQRVTFKPNPDFDPPSRECLVFEGMQGDIIVDVNQMQLAKIDGTLFKDVSIGWGIIGRLDHGGRFLVEQTEVYKGHWDQTHMFLDFTGKALLFKTIKIQENSTAWDFAPVQRMDVKAALDFLKSKENEGTSGTTTDAAR